MQHKENADMKIMLSNIFFIFPELILCGSYGFVNNLNN